MAAVMAAETASRLPTSGAFACPLFLKSGAAMMSAPARAMAMPRIYFEVGRSLSAIVEIAAMIAGCKLTRVTEAAIVVK